MVLKAYYIENQETVDQSHLDRLGVLHFSLDADNYEQEGKLAKICEDRKYNYKDFIDSTKLPNLPKLLGVFFEEHLHDDEEIRFFVDGSGFFDVRDGKDSQERWVRMECKKGDMIILPAGIITDSTPTRKCISK